MAGKMDLVNEAMRKMASQEPFTVEVVQPGFYEAASIPVATWRHAFTNPKETEMPKPKRRTNAELEQTVADQRRSIDAWSTQQSKLRSDIMERDAAIEATRKYVMELKQERDWLRRLCSEQSTTLLNKSRG